MRKRQEVKTNSYALFVVGTNEYAQNKTLDINKDGKVTKEEAVSFVIRARNSFVGSNPQPIPTPGLPHNPIGYLDVAEGGNGKIHVSGWALDYDAPATALEVHIYVGGAYGDSAIDGRAIKANKYRDDVPKALNNSSVGNYHGFDEWLDVGYTGTYPIYAYAINIGAKDSTNYNTRLTNAPKTITIRSAVQTCSTPNISFTDIINGKQVNISANSGETVNYTIKKNGASIGSGTAYESYSMRFSEE